MIDFGLSEEYLEGFNARCKGVLYDSSKGDEWRMGWQNANTNLTVAKETGCDFCKRWKESSTLYQTCKYLDLEISHFGNNPVLLVNNINKGCPPHTDCTRGERSAAFMINYCPNCGRKLKER